MPEKVPRGLGPPLSSEASTASGICSTASWPRSVQTADGFCFNGFCSSLQKHGGDDKGLHPYDGETSHKYTGPQPPYEWLNTDEKYSWVKAPTFYGEPAQVGPLSWLLAWVAAKHEPALRYTNKVVDTVAAVGGVKIGVDALHSTIGRHATRAISR